MLSRFEGSEYSRLQRSIPWLAQVAIYTILIVIFRDVWQEGKDQDSLGLNDEDIIQMVIVGVIGMSCLIPAPFIGSFLRRIAYSGIILGNRVATKNDE